MNRSAVHPKSKSIRKAVPARQTRPCRAPRRHAPRIHAPRPGQKCPQCQQGKLDYDGLLNLSCSQCGYVAGGGGFS